MRSKLEDRARLRGTSRRRPVVGVGQRPWHLSVDPSRRPFLIRALASAGVVAVSALILALTLLGNAGTAQATPSSLLRLAASAEQVRPDVVPLPSQYYYVKDGSYQAWLSVDGTRGGEVVSDGEKTSLPGCEQNSAAAGASSSTAVGCHPSPAYLSDAPTDAQSMASYLLSRSGSSSSNALGKAYMSILQFNYLRPASRAALFLAASKINGLSVVSTGDANTVGISWSAGGTSSTTMVFDRITHEYLGTTTIGAAGEVGVSAPRYAIVSALNATS